MQHFPLVFTAVVWSAVFAPQFVYQFVRQYRAVVRAEETTGTVKRASVEEYPDGSLVFTRYTPSVAFEYEWKGRPQESNNIRAPTGRLFPDRHYGARRKAEAVADEYEPGSEVTVYVDPGKPWEGFLVPEVTESAIAYPAARRAIQVSIVAFPLAVLLT